MIGVVAGAVSGLVVSLLFHVTIFNALESAKKESYAILTHLQNARKAL